MAGKNELIEIKMRLIGARQVAEEGERAGKGVKSVGHGAAYAGRESERASRKTGVLTRAYGQLGKAARYGIGFLGIGGVFALKSAVENTAELSKTTTGLNRNLGLSVQEGSRWAAVAHARGIATTALNMSFTKMAKSFVEANRKGGTARTALNQLGITQAQTAKGAHDFNYALGLVSKNFGKAHSGPERQAAAMSLLGKGYSTVLPLFAQGNKGLQEQLHWADKYGLTLDGKTNKSLMDMVNAQRESKVAMLGLQVSLTKALLPAIKGGEGQLQEFIATLNDPKMSGEEKIVKIEKQFEDLEETLIKVITAALPKVAESGGKLGLALAGAVWTGFENSNLAGKLVITAWLFKFMGGGGLIKATAGSLGGKIGSALLLSFQNRFPVLSIWLQDWAATTGTTVGLIFAGALVGAALGYEIYQHLSQGTKEAAHQWGINAAQNFVNGLISIINKGIDEINSVINRSIDIGPVHIHGPKLGHVGGVNFHSEEERRDEIRAGGGVIEGPGGSIINPKTGKQVAPPIHKPPGGSRRPLVFHIHNHLDGKQISESVIHHADLDAALA